MARHEVFDFAVDGFRRFVPPRFHHAAERLEQVFAAHGTRLATGRASLREGLQQYCHYATFADDAHHRIAVFNVVKHRAVIELYHPGVLSREVRGRCGHTKVGRDWATIVMPSPEKIDRSVKGHASVAEAIRVVGEYLDRLEILIRSGVARSSSSEGELVVHQILSVGAGDWHHRVRPAFIHALTGRLLELDFWNEGSRQAIEVMGSQHFSSVELWGGDRARTDANQRTLRKVEACAQAGVALLFARWAPGTLLFQAEEGCVRGWIADALDVAARQGRWTDLDEFAGGQLFPGYSFLRDAGLASALDSPGVPLSGRELR